MIMTNECPRMSRGWAMMCGLLGALMVLAGCSTFKPHPVATTNPPPIESTVESVHVGDSLTIIFSDLNPLIPAFEERVKEDGTITLIHNQTFTAAGKTRGDLEKEIRARYVPTIYVNLTVTIKPQERFYTVSGEVKVPGRQQYYGPTTVLKAIASCGDFTDFANKKKVRLTRAHDSRMYTINCKKALTNPRLDLEVLPNDSINVPRSIW
jgi:protein involved in polysaccharide export with SLBB domain